jgi:acyl-CoA synthetase (AMP-forming)/AMP-acid ligase II
LPGVAARVVDDNNVDVGVDVVGHLLVRGPTLFKGYLDDDSAVVDDAGFFATLDLASIDSEGQLSIVSRRGDLIVSGGENIYPVQIEEVLARCPGVVDVGVAALADAKWGQRPVAFVVLADAMDVQGAGVSAFGASALSRLQRPDRVVVVDELPRNAMGKLDRKMLRQWADLL